MIRKKAEEDAQLLANRIALLQLEEKRAMKKIEETKSKAKEIMSLKSRNLQMQKEKEMVTLQRNRFELIVLGKETKGGRRLAKTYAK